MGGGVGGMVYSIADGNIKCSHANHRGDVIARTDSSGSLTYFALYEAYGKRTYEWGSDPDRQKANTKEEESDLDLLNEGMRYRDLETGTFLTRDPIRYGDGPNMYCYVHCNPITRFDAWGLSVNETTTTDPDDGSTQTDYEIEAEIIFEDEDLSDEDKEQYKQDIIDALMETYNGKEGDHSWSLSADNLKITIGTSASEVSENNHAIIVTSGENMPSKDPNTGVAPPAVAERGGGAMWINTDNFNARTASHETTHWFGSKDTADPRNENITWQSRYSDSMELNSTVVDQQQSYVDQPGAVNNNLGPRTQTSEIIDPGNREALKAADPTPRRYLPGY